MDARGDGLGEEEERRGKARRGFYRVREKYMRQLVQDKNNKSLKSTLDLLP